MIQTQILPSICWASSSGSAPVLPAHGIKVFYEIWISILAQPQFPPPDRNL
jgi:hypothetical protein